jgi:dephospho-CoA kinase
MIIGLLGKAGSGKTTVANWLRDSYGAQKFSYAAPLKEMARRIYGLSDAQLFGTQEEKETIDPR